MNSPHFDLLQQQVLRTYELGEFAHLAPADVDTCGDGLLKFLLSEISQKEGCVDLPEAVRRLDASIRGLTEFRDRLNSQIRC
jgi:hypothetical protein